MWFTIEKKTMILADTYIYKVTQVVNLIQFSNKKILGVILIFPFAERIPSYSKDFVLFLLINFFKERFWSFSCKPLKLNFLTKS